MCDFEKFLNGSACCQHSISATLFKRHVHLHHLSDVDRFLDMYLRGLTPGNLYIDGTLDGVQDLVLGQSITMYIKQNVSVASSYV